MKCTNNHYYRRRRRRRRRRSSSKKIAGLILCLAVFIGGGGAAAFFLLSGSGNSIEEYEKSSYSGSLYEGELFAQDLCVSPGDVALDGFTDDTTVHGAALFDLTNDSVVYGYHLYDQLYPASTTKILTAYVALKYGNLEDEVTVSANATNFNWDESVCGLKTGDTVTMYDLLCGLMLMSGNDAAAAIAEHMSGSIEAFAELMNQEAAALGATGTHFVNPHGLPDDNHYTTVYDLYLFFNACMEDERFVDIISLDSYTATLKGADGTQRTEEWKPTQLYASGEAVAPEGIDVIGGKTGTTQKAGNCVVLYEEDGSGNPYISIIMGAETKPLLYDEMNRLFTAGIQNHNHQ